ncbi:probable hexosyltransferase MUCI70 isoform X2 [Trifolium pratense]|uniref:probable hexosyltransferase MUCI70 isoform X2 n=1 Tax=Trifolium pratense TaxID=57577 RepID=UPI001E697F60|nr:probable hexosyltransferase MUCI70 isoform X2 [Trifolium pratense]
MSGGGGSKGLGIRSLSYGSLDYNYNNNNNNNKQLQNFVPLSPIQLSSARKGLKMIKEKEKEQLFLWIFKFAGRKKVGMLFLCLISVVVFIWVLYVGKGEDSQEANTVQSISVNESVSASDSPSEISTAKFALIPSPTSYFLGYHLPPEHPCNSFTLPPPPADKKRIGPRPCPVCYLPVEEAIARMPTLPSPSPVLQNLKYVYEENLSRGAEFGGSEFGGYPTLKQRNESFDVQESMSVYCGFVRGTKPGHNTGFDIDEDDLLEMDHCNGVVVASAVFGNFDEINEPQNISDYSRKTICFLMFVDEVTEKYLRSSGRLGVSKKIGLWRIIVARKLPYTDARRTGKIPKLLLHRMVPNARYSIWLDGKLELVVDPYQILERFLWRKNATFSISKHYRRFDVFVEAEANKAAAKYDNASIDSQIEFYKKEGLTPYTEAKLPLISDVPEGCVIVREHVPISNLFTCLWFNEVDRFTSRDQLSFSTVRDKILSRVDFHFNMFLDCERRNFVVQKYHRDLLLRRAPPATTAQTPPLSPPPPLAMLATSPENIVTPPVRRGPGRRGKDKKRHRKVVAGSTENEAG